MRSISRRQGRLSALLLAVAVPVFTTAGLRGVPLSQQVPPTATEGGQSTGQPSAPVPPAASATPQLPEAHAQGAPLRNISFLVMIDPGHGGDDTGAHWDDGLLEKDLTLSLARRLKAELTERGIPARLLRETDTSLSLDERAEISNEQHSSVYLSLHAGTPGDGVRIYVPALASPPSPDSGRFLPWESAQSVFLGRSEALASALSAELIHRRLDVATLSLPLRPLNNVAACAIAVEMATGNDPHELASPKLQNAVAGAIATVVAQMRSQLEGQP